MSYTGGWHVRLRELGRSPNHVIVELRAQRQLLSIPQAKEILANLPALVTQFHSEAAARRSLAAFQRAGAQGWVENPELEAELLSLKEARKLFPAGLFFDDDLLDMRSNAIYSGKLESFGERALPVESRESGAEVVYRMLYLPSFDPQMMVRTWKSADGAFSVRAINDRSKPTYVRNFPSWLRPLDTAEWQAASTALDAYFSSVPKDPKPASVVQLDGAVWVLEKTESGHHVVAVEHHAPEGSPLHGATRACIDLLPQQWDAPRIYT